MINPIEAEKLAETLTDQTRVRLSYHSVQMTAQDQVALGNYLNEMLSNYADDSMMTGENQLG